MNGSKPATTVLVIEDEEIVRQSLRDQLEDLGYQVLTADRGTVGVKLFEQERPGVVLTDLRMPEMDGIAMIKHILGVAQDTPIIVISGAGKIRDAVEALRLGAYDYISKPVSDPDLLEHTIARAIEKASLVSENRQYQEQLENLVQERTEELECANRKLTNINNRLRKIVATTSSLVSCLDLNQFGSQLLSEFAEHMVATGGSLYVVEEDGLRLLHSIDPGHAPEKIDFPLPEGSILRRVIERREPLLVEDLALLNTSQGSGWEGYSNDSILVFPVFDEDHEVAAVLTLHNKVSPPFVEQDKEIGTILASYSAESLRAIRNFYALTVSEQRYRELTDMLPLSVCETDSNGTITYANRMALETFGYDSIVLTEGINVLDTIVPEQRDLAQENMECVLRNGETRTAGTEYGALRGDGSVFPALIYSAPVLTDGKPVGMRCAIVNISKMKEAELHIQEAKMHAEAANNAKSEFLATMSHELRTPLNSIIGFSQIMVDGAFGKLNNDKYEEYVNYIFTSAEHLLEVISDILDISKIEVGEIDVEDSELDVANLVEGAVTIVRGRAETGEQTLVIDVAKDLLRIMADGRLARQILVNLLTNAVKFTPGGGEP